MPFGLQNPPFTAKLYHHLAGFLIRPSSFSSDIWSRLLFFRLSPLAIPITSPPERYQKHQPLFEVLYCTFRHRRNIAFALSRTLTTFDLVSLIKYHPLRLPHKAFLHPISVTASFASCNPFPIPANSPPSHPHFFVAPTPKLITRLSFASHRPLPSHLS